MKPVAISIGNELESVVVLQSAVRAFSQAIAEELSLARQMELVVEEIITNIIKFEYLPGQEEQIELHLAYERQQMVLTIRFKGIPFDIEFLRQCEQVHLEDIVKGEARGIGLHLVRHFCDELQYHNLGRQGQEIVILRRLTKEKPPDAPAEHVESREVATKPVKTTIRRMLAKEAAAVSKLAYIAYNYSYIYEHIYDPEQVRQLNASEQLISYVVINLGNDEIIGHGALLPNSASGLDELGVAFVHPAYRGSGCLNELTERLMEAAKERQRAGVFAIAVASHPYSQRAAGKFGMREAALLVSRGTPLLMTAIPGRKVARETVVSMVKLNGEVQRGTYYLPPQHREMVGQICDNLGIAFTFAEGSSFIALPEKGALKQEIDDHQAGHIFLLSYGRDTMLQVRRIVRGWCLDRLETIYLYLPLRQLGTSTLTSSFEKSGFFFSGLQLGQAGSDKLVLQYLNNQRYDYSALKPATPFGQKLIDYVCNSDPDGSGSSESPVFKAD